MDYLSENIGNNRNELLDFFITNFAGYWYCKNINLAYISCNHNYAALLGKVSICDVIDKKDTDFNWLNNLSNSFNDDEEVVLATQKTQVKEYQFLNGDKAIYIRFERVAIFNDQDVLVGIQATGLDITDSKLREQKTMAEHAFVEDILYNLPGLVYWKNRHSQYMGFNRNVVELSGLTREELKGRTDKELNWGAKEADIFIKEDQEIIETGAARITEHELPIMRADQHRIIIRTEKSRLFDSNGNVVGVLGLSVDITNEKLLEKELLEIHLKKEKELIYNFEYIIHHMPGYIYWKDKNSKYMGCNANLAKVSGLHDPAEIVGKTDYDFSWGKDKAAEFVADDQRVMQQKSIQTTEYALPISRNDGRYLVVRTDKMPLYNKNGDIIGVLAIAIDITEQKILEEALVEEKNRVEALSHAKTFFIRNMEHDIRTPFGGIYTIADALEQVEEDEEKKDYLKAISQSAKELLDYCNNILDFSRLEAGTLPLASKKFNLRDLLESIIKIERPAAQAKKLKLELQYDDKIPAVLIGDPYRLQRILINIVSNAIKFTHKGHVILKVELPQLADMGPLLILRFFVEDTGIGIPEEHQAHIYEPLQRLSPSNRGLYKGSGLGLTIVKQLVEELHGEIDLHSVINEGSIFICTIPFKQPLLHEIL